MVFGVNFSPLTFYLGYAILLTVMEKYELTICLPEKATSAKKKSFLEKLSKLVKLFEGKISKDKDWGKIDFSYIIKKNTAGNFLFFELELTTKSAKELMQKLSQDEEILRYLMIRVK